MRRNSLVANWVYIQAQDTRQQRAVGSKAALRGGLCFSMVPMMRTWVYVDGRLERTLCLSTGIETSPQ
jgi:hypothetical protein